MSTTSKCMCRHAPKRKDKISGDKYYSCNEYCGNTAYSTIFRELMNK